MRIAARYFLTIATAGALVLAAAQTTNAQDAANANVISELVAGADWTKVPIAPGVDLRMVHFEHLLGTRQFVSVLDIDLDAPGIAVDIVQADSGRMRTSDIATYSGAVAATNAGFFESDGTPSLFFQDDGVVVRADDDDRIRFFEDGAVATDSRGDAVVVRRAHAVWRPLPDFSDVLVAGPLLVWDGQVVDAVETGFNLTHHPRTAAGLTSTNHLMLVTVDGRTVEAAGMTSHELALLMQALGCQTALNLDGGGSTTMWVAGRGVVNHPSDNGAFDANGERAVSNAIIVRVR